MSLRPIFVLALLVVSAPAFAGTLYRCTDAQGAVSIQSDPCPRGSTQDWKREAAPEPGPSPEELAARAALAQAEAERVAEQARLAEEQRLLEQARREEAVRQATRETSSEPPARKSECTLAHEFSDAAAAKPWLALTQSQRESIRSWVIATCRDPDPILATPAEG
jgi:hypothetical protein